MLLEIGPCFHKFKNCQEYKKIISSKIYCNWYWQLIGYWFYIILLAIFERQQEMFCFRHPVFLGYTCINCNKTFFKHVNSFSFYDLGFSYLIILIIFDCLISASELISQRKLIPIVDKHKMIMETEILKGSECNHGLLLIVTGVVYVHKTFRRHPGFLLKVLYLFH